MDWNIRLSRALDYIEDNLSGDIDFEHAARLAFCTRGDLSNMFAVITGVQLGEYIRRRRLSLAALEVQHGDTRIIDIALKYGYSSPTAFNRAFQSQHKASPQYARSRGIFLATYPRISFQITIKGETDMKCRIEKKPAFSVAGMKKNFRNDSEENMIPAFWSELPTETYDLMRSLPKGEPKGLLGLCANFGSGHTFDYYICVAAAGGDTRSLETFKVPEATWAIFEAEGELGDLANRVWQEWFPSSGYRRAGESIPDVEVYFDYDFPKYYHTYELWYPVEKE